MGGTCEWYLWFLIQLYSNESLNNSTKLIFLKVEFSFFLYPKFPPSTPWLRPQLISSFSAVLPQTLQSLTILLMSTPSRPPAPVFLWFLPLRVALSFLPRPVAPLVSRLLWSQLNVLPSLLWAPGTVGSPFHLTCCIISDIWFLVYPPC